MVKDTATATEGGYGNIIHFDMMRHRPDVDMELLIRIVSYDHLAKYIRAERTSAL